MLSRITLIALSTGCCLALFATLHAIDFAVDLEGTNVFDPELPWSLIDASYRNQ